MCLGLFSISREYRNHQVESYSCNLWRTPAGTFQPQTKTRRPGVVPARHTHLPCPASPKRSRCLRTSKVQKQCIYALHKTTLWFATMCHPLPSRISILPLPSFLQRDPLLVSRMEHSERSPSRTIKVISWKQGVSGNSLMAFAYSSLSTASVDFPVGGTMNSDPTRVQSLLIASKSSQSLENQVDGSGGGGIIVVYCDKLRSKHPPVVSM
jgi:hypothetical protein